jgi:hypothetical protein
MKRPSYPEPGDIILADSFCNCKVEVTLLREDDMGWWGYITSPKDLKCLRKNEVKLSKDDETFVFDFHIIKIIRKS